MNPTHTVRGAGSRVTALTAAMVLVSTAASAEAGPRRCPLVQDRAHDAGSVNEFWSEYTPNDESLDLRTLDLTSTPQRLGIVVGVEQLARTTDQWFEVRFSVDDTDFYVAAYLPREGVIEQERYSVGYFSDEDGDAGGYASLGAVRGHADVAGSRISFVVDTRLLAPREQLRPGVRLTAVEAQSYRAVGMAQAIFRADFTEPATFTFGQRGCIGLPRLR